MENVYVINGANIFSENAEPTPRVDQKGKSSTSGYCFGPSGCTCLGPDNK